MSYQLRNLFYQETGIQAKTSLNIQSPNGWIHEKEMYMKEYTEWLEKRVEELTKQEQTL